MPRRIVIHAGFHKTGTSTVQTVLKTNRSPLKPFLRSLLRPAMTDLVHAARGFSTWRDPFTLDKFARRFESLLLETSPMPRRTLCLSCEELSGHLPGRGSLADYSAVPILASEMARVASGVHPAAEILFYFSTRAPEPWLDSAYWQHVKSSSLTLGWAQFAETYRTAADLNAIVDHVASAQPNPVHRARMEDTGDGPAGLATPLLRLCGVPEQVMQRLTRPDPVNARPDPGVLLALLDANRDYADRDTRKAAKQAILRGAKEKQGE